MKKSNKKIKEEQGFFKKNYILSWQYVRESFNYILAVIILLLFGSFIGLVYQPQELLEAMRAFIENLLAETSGLNLWQMILYIFENNLKSSFFGMFFGVFLGIVPTFTALANGYILGFVSSVSVVEEGPLILLRLVPHGIFEFPAIVLALAIGIKLGFFLFTAEKKKELVRRLEGSLRVFLFIILPLLVIAAIVEGFLIFSLP